LGTSIDRHNKSLELQRNADPFEVISNEEIAKQISYMDYKIFNAIKPWELIQQVWKDQRFHIRNSAIIEMIARFNAITNWVVVSVLRPKRAKDRARFVTKFIKIAKYLRAIQNFHSLMAILGGLNHSAIIRLSKTKSYISKRYLKALESLDLLMSMKGNFNHYRSLLDTISPPCIPFLGLIISDFVFVDQGNEDTIDDLINFSKRKLMYNCIEELQQFQSSQNLESGYKSSSSFTTEIRITKMPIKTEEELYEMSLKAEPLAPGENSFTPSSSYTNLTTINTNEKNGQSPSQKTEDSENTISVSSNDEDFNPP